MSDNKATDPVDTTQHVDNTQSIDNTQPASDVQTGDDVPPVDPVFKKYIPIATVIFCAASVVLFLGINLFEDKPFTWEAYRKWGAPSFTEIFEGDYWGLITSNFLHTEVWHIIFNLFWFWFLGKKIEFESNKLFYLLLVLSSALVSSLAQLSFSDASGIGLSGIAYAFFGFVFIKSKSSEAYKNYLDQRSISLFFIWLVACIVITKLGFMNIGNAAHVGGLVWGMLLAYLTRFAAYKQWAGALLFLAVLASSVWWSPFSVSWLSYQAGKLHNDQKLEEAMVIYRKILDRDADNEFAKINLKQLEIYTLSQKAYKLQTDKKFKEAREIYNKILAIDKDNAMAKENLQLLPAE
ncbi:MAG: rhomboid family intramembrane serine protease [Niastella sp.]|nr:rhomboid family intramembrane serine protease [Niastella sp.]